jgi:hypothetical protein
MSNPTAKKPDPQCPVCKGLGWYQGPSYGNFAPEIDIFPCPDCNEAEPIGRTGCLLAVAFLAIVIALVAWGAK